MNMDYDFSGWATRNDIRCSDGRVIKPNAFADNDGKVVPLVWNHQHNEASNVLGHALLENRPQGVYAYCTFNNNEFGQTAKELVEHGDITSLSIYANKLKHNGHDVIHGAIREVSLVLAGANPGAYIDTVIAHSDDDDTEEAVIYNEEQLEGFYHADEDGRTVQDVLDELTDEQRNVVYALIGMALEDGAAEEDDEEYDEYEDEDMSHADEYDEDEDEESEEDMDEDLTIGEIFDTLDDEQQAAVYAVIGMALEDAGVEIDEEGEVKHNVFEDDFYGDDYLSHADCEAIFDDAKRYGSLKDSVLAHGIEDIEWLFPDDQMLDDAPAFVGRKMEWVDKLMSKVHHTPFSRIKSMFADITEADARAKGYVKGNMKIEEVFTLLKRTTSPTTIYKKQKLDRDDVVDITDFDVVAWLKTEMRMMLDEEIARAILVGDGRSTASDEKINEQNIRPIWTDDDFYSIKKPVDVLAADTDDQKIKKFIRAAVKSRKDYKGSGNPILYTTEDILTDCLLLEDTTGRIIYESVDKLKSALRVSDIVTVPVMEGLTRVDSDSKTRTLLGIIVNPIDYNVGADKGGAVNMFDDFDIDYNAQKYLIETRCSGALIKPYSAIVLEQRTVTQ